MTNGCRTPIGATRVELRGCTLFLLIALGCTLATSAAVAQSDQLKKSKTVAPRDAVGLNPQPEPPSRKKMKQRLRPGEMRGLNPQPEPPMPARR